MKKVFYFFLIIFLALILSGCNVSERILPEPHSIPTLGVWHDHTYVNEFIGLQFELPETWFIYTREQVYMWYYSQRSTLGRQVVGNNSSQGDIGIGVDTIDMRARDFFNNNNIFIYFEPLSAISRQRINELEFLQMTVDYIYDNAIDMLQNTQISETPRQIGDTNWYYVTHDTLEGGVQANFVSIIDEFMYSISITVLEGDMQNIDEFWDGFTEIEPQFLNMEGTIPVMRDIPSLIHHGSWDGHTYVNPSLNLEFTVPIHYSITTNDEIAAALGLPSQYFGDGLIGSNLWVEAIRRGDGIIIMRAHSSGHNSVMLEARRKPIGMRDFPIERQLQIILGQNQNVWAGRGVDVQIYTVPRLIEISGHQWLAGRLEMYLAGSEFITDTLITVVDGNIWAIQIESNNEYEFQEILSMFSVID